MKGFLLVALVVWLAGELAACVLTSNALIPDTAGDSIQPGDRIGNFLITTGNREEEIFTWQMQPIKGEDPTDINYNIESGQKFNPCLGIYDDTHKGKMDFLWSQLSYEMYIEDRPVDLKAFGTVQSLNPAVGMMRHWNVVILSNEPGKISVHIVGKFMDQTFDDTSIYTILAP